MSTQARANGSRSLAAFLAGSARLVCGKLIDWLRRRAAARAGARRMAQLDDRLLRDIGLTRLQIHGAAFGLLRLGPCASPLGAPPPSAPAGGERPKRRVSAARLDQAASRRWPAAQRAGRCAGAAASIGED